MAARVRAALATTNHPMYVIDHPRYVIGFGCSEFGVTQYDEYDKQGGACHIWPVWDGIEDCPEISERTKGVLYIKAVGGHINWNRLGRRDRVTVKHCDHFFSIYDPILRSLGLFPGPCMWHAAPETVRTCSTMA